ncbi:MULTISPECIES: glutathione peroxidase [Legionella]|uniref:Glutathione peroxidase n=1 Tax=Legionella drozanskii LLAP-1 TaxID=1212489 RepID=A0A0W0SWS9_9GAMM|nr:MULTISPECIES: glutathione peroxidase [Legionella]KTC87413.1 glutathione peroxidase [Legionella drozanskii LLAP-1]PJE08507.1 MAG: glutathione peroxidase [Legionella sp.]
MSTNSPTNLYTTEVTTIAGQRMTLEPYQGQVLLIVNVASRCGFTPQYAELETLYREFKTRGFSILAFPCDQFLHQEPGSNQEIQTFAESCFNISFPLFAKIDVKGKEQAPLFTYLAKHIKKRPWKFIPWNFTKILVDTQGRVLKRYLPTTSLKKIRKEIEPLLPVNN